jgi:hypothetical protein
VKQKLINRLVNDVGSRCPVGAIAGKLAVMLLVLTFVSCATDAPAPGMDTDVHCGEQQITRVYQHTYDEVFQACQEAIERLGWSITDKDSDKGTINGFGTINVFNAPAAEKSKGIFSLHVETLNTKPEVSVTFNGHYTRKSVLLLSDSTYKEFIRGGLGKLSDEVQKVLATYH